MVELLNETWPSIFPNMEKKSILFFPLCVPPNTAGQSTSLYSTHEIFVPAETTPQYHVPYNFRRMQVIFVFTVKTSC